MNRARTQNAEKQRRDYIASIQFANQSSITQQGLLRLATNPSAFGEDAVTLSEAWQILDMLLGDPRISFADEMPGIELYWREYTRQRTFSPKVWNDAYLAAFARAANYDLVTFDRAFSQYGGLKCMILS